MPALRLTRLTAHIRSTVKDAKSDLMSDCDRCGLEYSFECHCDFHALEKRVDHIQEEIDKLLDLYGTVSVSLLMRKFKMTHDEAMKIIDRLKEEMDE